MYLRLYRRVCSIVAAVVVALLGVCEPAIAEESARERSEEELFELPEEDEAPDEGEKEAAEGPERRRDVPLREMSPREARRAGFEFGDESVTTRRTTGSLLAATGGLVVHGLGHWYVEDPRTAATLGIVEGGSLALAGTGLGLWLTRFQTDSPLGHKLGPALFQLGTGLFGLSYLIDVVGALQGARLRLPPNTGRASQLSVQTGYRYLHDQRTASPHFFTARADYDIGPVFGDVRTRQGFRLETSDYELDLGVRLLRGARQFTHLYVASRGDWLVSRRESSFRRVRGEGRLGISVNLGLLAAHLEQIVAGLEVGWGTLAYRRPVGDDGAFSWVDNRWYLPVEVYTDMNLSERLNLRVSYDKRPGEPLQPEGRLAGVGKLRLRYDSSEMFDLEIAGRFGDGYSLQAGLVVRVFE